MSQSLLYYHLLIVPQKSEMIHCGIPSTCPVNERNSANSTTSLAQQLSSVVLGYLSSIWADIKVSIVYTGGSKRFVSYWMMRDVTG